MFGFIHESIRQMMLRKYGNNFWSQVLVLTGMEAGKENIVNHYYDDSVTYSLIDSVSVLSKMPREQVWEDYGEFIIEYTMEIGWDDLMHTMSTNLKGFLDNLDSFHYFVNHVVYKANLRGPSFRCEENQDGSLTLHYYTGRQGVLRKIARLLFNSEISITMTGRTQRTVQIPSGERFEEHVIFIIKNISNDATVSNCDNLIGLNLSTQGGEKTTDNGVMMLSNRDFIFALPYHLIIDQECRIIQAGREFL